MKHSFICCLLLRLITYIQCTPSLQIRKKIDDTFLPVSSKVEEFRGARFTLLCELVSSENNTYFDNQISWVKKDDLSKANNGTVGDISSNSSAQSFSADNAVNKANKVFDPLKSTDEGVYICVSFKYTLFKDVEVIVLNDKPYEDSWQHLDAKYCNDHMFKCIVSGLCIQKRYVCDGKEDCKDGSDESHEICNGDACQDKVRCPDGRCIPISWCCDKHVDPNCTVTITPSCCQILLDSYEMEDHYVSNAKHNSENGARYLFISICSLSIIFSMALFLLLLMKIVMFARKSITHSDTCPNENINLQGASSFIGSDCAMHVPRNVYAYRIIPTHQGSARATGDVAITEPLFPDTYAERYYDDPPSYNDIAKNNLPTINIEPPPPYTSREQLDII